MPAPPGDLGNTLRAVKQSSTNIGFQWAGDAAATSYGLYRGIAKGAWPPPPPWRTGLRAPSVASSGEVRSSPELTFYRAVAQTCGLEGP